MVFCDQRLIKGIPLRFDRVTHTKWSEIETLICFKSVVSHFKMKKMPIALIIINCTTPFEVVIPFSILNFM